MCRVRRDDFWVVSAGRRCLPLFSFPPWSSRSSRCCRASGGIGRASKTFTVDVHAWLLSARGPGHGRRAQQPRARILPRTVLTCGVGSRSRGKNTHSCKTGMQDTHHVPHLARRLVRRSLFIAVWITLCSSTRPSHHENSTLSLMSLCPYRRGRLSRRGMPCAPQTRSLLSWLHAYHHALTMTPQRQGAFCLCHTARPQPRPPRALRASRRALRLSCGDLAFMGGAWFPTFGRSSPC